MAQSVISSAPWRADFVRGTLARLEETEAMTYRGTVKGRVIELDGGVRLPEGMAVEIVVRESEDTSRSVSDLAPGGPSAILEALKRPSRCTDEDVATLLGAIAEGKTAAHFEGVFDS